MSVNSCSNSSLLVSYICFLMMKVFHLQISLIVLASGFIWNEIKQMWDSGFRDYIDDWWNLVDFIMNSLYIATIALKIIAYVKVLSHSEGIVFWKLI